MSGGDDLYRKVAKSVLGRTLGVKKGESVTVECWNNGLPFARRVVAEARATGCRAALMLEDEEAYIEGITRAPKESLGKMGDNEYGLLEKTDAYVFVPGPLLAAYQTKVDPRLLSESLGYNGPWYDSAEKAKIRGARVTFGYVGEEMAEVLGRTVKAVTDRQLNAALVDPEEMSEQGQKLSSKMDDGAELSLQSGRGATLRFALKGPATVEDGRVSAADIESGDNMAYVPPGFVTNAVEPSSASGVVRASRSLTRLGMLGDATLTFREGRLVEWASQKDEKKLSKLVDAVPEEKRRLTLANVGINPKMGYLYGQDRMVAGSVTLAGFGFTAVVREGDLSAGGARLVSHGKL